MAEQQFSHGKDSSLSDSWTSQLNSMSYSELIQLADRQKRQIESNSSAMVNKEIRLNNLRGQQQPMSQNGEAQSMLSVRLHQLRQQVKAEDAQLQHLRRLRAEVEDERRRSVTARVDLQEARRVFAEKEKQLKEAANRVQELLRQLDLVRRRRMVLNKENELKRLDAAVDAVSNGRAEKSGGVMTELSTVSSTSNYSLHYQRPKAAIEPFKIVPPSQSMPTISSDKSEIISTESFGQRGGDYVSYGSSADYLHSKGFVAAFTAMEEVLQQTTDSRSSAAVNCENAIKAVYATPVTGRQTPAIGSASQVSGQFAENGTYVDSNPASATDSQQRSDTSLPQSVIPKVNISINRRFQIANASPLLYEERPPPDLIPASEKTKFSGFDNAFATDGAPSSSTSIPAPELPENSTVAMGGNKVQHHHQQYLHDAMHPIEADKFHFRNDTLRAAKRRSWAENHHHLPATTDEAEHIRFLLARAQQKGKSSLNLSWIFEQLTTSEPHQNYYAGRQQRSASVVPSITASYPPPMPNQSYSIGPNVQDEEFLVEPSHPAPLPPATIPPPIDPTLNLYSSDKGMENREGGIISEAHLGQNICETENLKVRSEDLEMIELDDRETKVQRRHVRRESDIYKPEDDEDDELSAATIVEIISSDIQLKSPPPKGILRLKPKDESERGRRIRFDTLALLLDAALEGELDLVKSCASKVPNVSTSTEEGITALHNAICAGHYEIVRFLVEAGADVNAEDGDGWTPLHCAASCNNLPMVKFLIERGACIFATTTNDHETPADKCEEDEEGFDGCSQFLIGIQEKLGVFNGGRVYAAYEYEGEHEDELDLQADEPILILRREDEKEKGWWWAKLENTGEEGYVPRNYLALYPRLAAQRAGAMISPSSPPSAEQNPEQEDSHPPEKIEMEEIPNATLLTVES